MKKILIFLSLSFLLFFGIVSSTINVEAYTEGTHDVTITTIIDGAENVQTTLNDQYGSLITPISNNITPDGHVFKYWIVNGVVRKDLDSDHEFFVTADLEISAIFEPSDGSTHAVLFIDSNGKLIHNEFVASGKDVEEYSDLEGFSKPQYVVASTPWKEVNGSEAVFSNITESKVFVLQYELAEDVEPVVITVDGIENEFAYNQVVTITSELEDFSHWEEDGVIVSYDREYKFTALVNRNLVAKTDSTPKPLISLINATGIKEGYKSFLGQFYLPNGYKLIEAGVLASNEEKVLFLDSDNTTVVKSTSILESTNEFLRSFPEGSFSTFRAYAVLKNGEGIQTFYSDNNYYQLPELPLEQVFYETGFESNEGFTTSTSYQAGMIKNGWTVVNGAVTDTAASADDLHLQMRLYSSGTITATYHNTELMNKISKVEFFIGGSNGASTIKVHFSEDGNTWSTGVDLPIGSSNPKSVISDIPNARYVRWTTSDSNPEDGNKRYNLDDVKIYSLKDDDPTQEDRIIKLYNVEFNIDETSTNDSVRFGETVNEPTAPTKTGYTFIGWYDESDVEFVFDTKINSHIKLYAKFEEIPVSTISEIKSLPIDSNVITKGIVTSLIGNSAFIQDETGGIYLYLGSNSDYAEILVVGNEVKVVGKMDNYNNLIQISTIDNIELLNTNQELPAAVEIEELDLDDILEQQGKLITINGLTIKSIPTIGTAAYSVVVTDGTVDLEIRVDQYISTFAEVKALFEGAYVGQGINLVNIPVGRFKEKPQVMASLVSQLVLQPLSQELLESILKDELNPGVVTTEDLNLLTSIKIRNTTYSVTWSSDKPAITNMGIVTRPEAGEDNVVVTLTAVVKNDINETIATLYFEVVVLAEIVDAEPVTVTASYTGETGNMTEGNNASEINLDQNIFTVTSIKRENSPLHIGLNVAGQIRLYGSTNGNGNILEISIANGYKITNVKFNFGSTVGNALIKIGDEIKFSGALTANSSKEFSDLNDTSFSIQNKNSGTGQIYILSIEITYIPG